MSGSGPAPRIHRWASWLGLALVLAPLLAYVQLVATASVEVPYLDDYDAVVDYLTRSLGEDASGRLRRFFSRHNEHVMVTLRTAVWASYGAFGRIDFAALNLAGSGFLLLLLGALFASFRPGDRAAAKLLLFAPAALLLVQPQYWMVLISATTSLSNIAVAAWAALAFLALQRGTRPAFAAAVLCAALASFSLGSGALVLPLGALQLALARRRRDAALWSALAVPLLLGAILVDPQGDTALRGLDRPDRILLYALNFAGGAAAFSQHGFSLAAGGLLVASFGLAWSRGLHRHSPVTFLLFLFVFGSIAANAMLRAHQGVGAPLLQPRYRFYASLLLALSYLGWMEILLGTRSRVASRVLAASLTVALAFSLLSFGLYRGHVLRRAERLAAGIERWWTSGEGGLSHPDFQHQRCHNPRCPWHRALLRVLLLRWNPCFGHSRGDQLRVDQSGATD